MKFTKLYNPSILCAKHRKVNETIAILNEMSVIYITKARILIETLQAFMKHSVLYRLNQY